MWGSLLQVIQMYPDRLREKTRRYFSVAGDVTTTEKGLTSKRNESLTKKRMLHIRKGNSNDDHKIDKEEVPLDFFWY